LRTLSREEAIALIVAVTPLSAADMEGFLACTPEEQAVLVQAYRDAGTMPDPSAWDRVVAVLSQCAELAGLVLPILGVVSGVFALKGQVTS
jgi:hypothetical protein